MRLELSRYISVAEAVSKLLSPFAEVVIHDLSTNKIEAIFNLYLNEKLETLHI